MNPQTFIEKAIAGGYALKKMNNRTLKDYVFHCIGDGYSQWGKIGSAVHIPHEVILINPLAWSAVGKTEGWDKEMFCPICGNGVGRDCDCPFLDEWQYRQLHFISLLQEGKDLETALKESTL